MEVNKIYLGDSYELIKKLPDKSVDLVIIDPPYEIVSGGGGGAFGVENRSYHEEVSKKLNYGITNDILIELERVMKKTNIYIFCNKNQLKQYFNFYDGKNIDLLVWHKKNPIPTVNNKYLSDLEYIVFIRDKGVAMYNTYETSSKLYQTTTNKIDKDLYVHPTIKPIELIKRYILNSSLEGDLVLDTFLGSGTTAVACKETNRRYIGFEINEEYYKIAQDRLNGVSQVERREKQNGVMNIFDFMEE